MGGQRNAPDALHSGMTRYPLHRRLDGPQGRSGRVRKISSPLGFDPRTVKPIASRYTDSAIPAQHYLKGTMNNVINFPYIRNICYAKPIKNFIQHVYCDHSIVNTNTCTTSTSQVKIYLKSSKKLLHVSVLDHLQGVTMSSLKSLLLLATVGCLYAKSGDVAACRVVCSGLCLKSA